MRTSQNVVWSAIKQSAELHLAEVRQYELHQLMGRTWHPLSWSVSSGKPIPQISQRPNGHFHPTAHFGILGTEPSLATFTQQHILGTELSLATLTQQHYFGLKFYLATFTQPANIVGKMTDLHIGMSRFPQKSFLYPDLHLATFIHWPYRDMVNLHVTCTTNLQWLAHWMGLYHLWPRIGVGFKYVVAETCIFNWTAWYFGNSHPVWQSNNIVHAK